MMGDGFGGHPYGSDAGIARERMSVLADLLSPRVAWVQGRARQTLVAGALRPGSLRLVLLRVAQTSMSEARAKLSE